MGGVAKTVGRIGGDIVTGGLAETNLGGGIFKKAGNFIGNGLTFGAAGLGHSDSHSAVSFQGGGAGQNPVQMLASTGGAPLLTNIALGVNPKDALAGYFGVKRSEWDDFRKGLTPQEQSSVDETLSQLQQVQSNTDLRNKAVSQLVNDFPNIVSTQAKNVVDAKQRAGVEFDQTTKAVLDQASNQLAAKYASTGGFSSGAFNQGLAQSAGDMALQRLNYTSQAGDQQLGLNYQDWSNQYNEANALRGFQQTMLGQGVQQGFSASQASLNRQQQSQLQQNDFSQQNAQADRQQQNQLFGAVGGLAGTALGAYFGGPIGASMGGQMGSMIGSGGGMGSPRLNLYNQGSSGYSRYSGSGNGF